MMIALPPLHSVWGNEEGGKIFIEHVYDEATDPDAELEDGDEPQFVDRRAIRRSQRHGCSCR